MVELELRDYLGVLRKRKWIVAVAMVACIGGAALATALTTPVYQATSKLFVGQRQIASTELTSGAAINQLSLQLLKSYAAILRTRPIAESAIEREELPLAPTDLSAGLRADPVLDTQLITLSYQSTDPALAQRVVNAVAAAFVGEVERIETRPASDAEPAVRVSVVESALQPDSPIRPQPVRNMALALVLGAMLGVGLAFAVEYFDTTVKGSAEAEQISGAPVLASIPKVDGDRAIYVASDSQSAAAEAFRKLRTAIHFLGVDHPVQVVLVTSPEAAEGKTTTCLNLAAAFAQAGLRTILVEADLRRPVLHTIFPCDGQRGLTTALIGRATLEQVVMQSSVRNLSYVPAGAVPPNPAELLASDHMGEILQKLRGHAEVVVIDSPPLLPVADASALASRTDGVLLVTRSGQTHRDRLAEASELVGKIGGRLLGVVLNGQTSRDGGYGYYYGFYPRRPGHGPAFQVERAHVPRATQPTGSAFDQGGVA